jgi:hypothetical protein
MSELERTNLRLPDLLHDLAGDAVEPLDDVLRVTAHMRQRPAWTFPERWLPMTDLTARPISYGNRPLLFVALLVLLVAAFAVVASGIWRPPTAPLPAQLDINAAAAQRLEIESASYPAVGLGALWVTIAGAGVGQHDVATGEPLRLTQIDAGPCGSIEVAFDRVWTPTCAIGGVASVDTTGASTFIPLGALVADEEATIGVDGDGLWVVGGAFGEQLFKLDPQLGEVTARYSIPSGSANPEVGFGSVWIAGKSTGTVLRLDPGTGATQSEIAVGSQPRFLAAGEDAMWVVNQLAGTVSRIDPISNQVVTTIEVGPIELAGDIEVAGGSVWVRATDNLVRIDPATNTVVETFGPMGPWGAITTDGVAVWVTEPDAGVVWRLDR